MQAAKGLYSKKENDVLILIFDQIAFKDNGGVYTITGCNAAKSTPPATNIEIEIWICIDCVHDRFILSFFVSFISLPKLIPNSFVPLAMP
jgi:hypothetical protein